MTKRILIDASGVNITKPSGGAYCVKAYLEALLSLYPGLVDVVCPQEFNITDTRFNIIPAKQRTTWEKITHLLKGHVYRGAEPIIKHLYAHKEEYSCVFFNGGVLASSVLKRLKDCHLTTIVLHHNFESEYHMDSRTMFTLKGKTDKWIRYLEKRAYHLASINLFLTEQDRQLFETHYGKRENNYVTGIFEPSVQHFPLTKSATQSAVITCSLGSEQNKRPLLRFMKRFYPLFHDILPQWELHIMGRNPGAEILELEKKYPNVFITPDPPDLNRLAAQSAIYICPMDSGGGLKLRIMDGLRAGQPILTHQRAARGYDALVNEQFFQLYDDEDSFVTGLKTILEYINNNPLYKEEIQNKYYASFSFEKGRKELQDILSNLL